MDVFAHVLWTNAVFYKKYKHNKRERYIAAFFGVLPDLLSFTPVFFFFLVSGFRFTPEALLSSSNWAVRYAQESYNFTHSLVIFAALFLLVTLLRKGKVYWPMLGWALHIGIDIFTHHNFYETPFLFPLSSFRNNFSISWGQPVFMLLNYASIALVYACILRYRDKKKRQTK
jgi:membrane-bound metal-dependent hydrolase YbcI (DUF457 family)